MANKPPTTSFDVILGIRTAAAPQPRATDAPFRMLILGDLTGRANRRINNPDDLPSRRLLSIDRDNFDDVLEKLAPTLELRLGSDRADATTIAFRELDDFHPDRLFERVELFEQLRRMRRRLMSKDLFSDAAAELTAGQVAAVSAPETETEPQPNEPQPTEIPSGNLLDAAMAATDESAISGSGGSPMERVIQEIIAPYIEPAADPRQSEFVAAVDTAIGEQMRRLLHHPEFQALEAAWRGLDLLVRRLETDRKLKLQLLNVSMEEMTADLSGCEELSSSALWKLLSDQSIGTPGNDPFACLIGLFEVCPTEESIATINGLAGISQQLGAAVLAGANSRLAGCESFGESPDPSDWTATLDDTLAAQWQRFRNSTGSWASPISPRFLLRLPYGKKTDPTDAFTFEEMQASPNHADYLWGHSSVLGALLLGSGFSEQGWNLQADARMEVDRLPIHVFEADGDREQKPCAEAWLTERSAETLTANGLTTVFSVRNRDAVLLPGLRNAAEPSGPLSVTG